MKTDKEATGNPAQVLQRRLKGIHFKAVTAYNRLKEDVQLSSSTSQMAERIKDLGREFRVALEECKDEGVKESVPTQKIIRDFQGVLQRSEVLMKELEERHSRRSAYNSHAEQREASHQLELQELQRQQQMVQKETYNAVHEAQLRHNEVMIQERDVAITEISGQIGEVHQIFQDLAVLVHDQGGAVDDIESNLSRTVQKTQDAHAQVRRAEKSQRRAARNWCFLTMLGAGAVTILFLVLAA